MKMHVSDWKCVVMSEKLQSVFKGIKTLCDYKAFGIAKLQQSAKKEDTRSYIMLW